MIPFTKSDFHFRLMPWHFFSVSIRTCSCVRILSSSLYFHILMPERVVLHVTPPTCSYLQKSITLLPFQAKCTCQCCCSCWTLSSVSVRYYEYEYEYDWGVRSMMMIMMIWCWMRVRWWFREDGWREKILSCRQWMVWIWSEVVHCNDWYTVDCK